MAAIPVLDADGVEVNVELPLTPGRAAAASSKPVALSTEDFAVIDGIEAALASILAKIIAAPATETTLAAILAAFKAEDSVHVTADPGIMALAVRSDTAAATGANGDYVPLTVDSSGKLWIHRDGVETTPTPAGVTLVANTAKDLLAGSGSRVRCMIYNPLATVLFCRKAAFASSPATVAAGGYDFVVLPGQMWKSEAYEWSGGINGICATAGDVAVSNST